ncbi:MAG: hypothetical protein AAGG72_07115 [Pseudomonadota bacterium]
MFDLPLQSERESAYQYRSSKPDSELTSLELVTRMGLKAPGIITFLIAVVLTVTVLITKFFAAEIPFLLGNEFWVLLASHALLMLGCLMRAL